MITVWMSIRRHKFLQNRGRFVRRKWRHMIVKHYQWLYVSVYYCWPASVHCLQYVQQCYMIYYRIRSIRKEYQSYIVVRHHFSKMKLSFSTQNGAPIFWKWRYHRILEYSSRQECYKIRLFRGLRRQFKAFKQYVNIFCKLTRIRRRYIFQYW